MEIFIRHHGIRGMKWGIRRFQNKDGSLTKAGKKRLAQKEGEKKEAETKEQIRARILKSTNAQEIYANRNLLSTSEINERLTRIDTERRLGVEAEKSKVTFGKKVKKIVEAANEASKTINDAYQITQQPAFKAMMKKLKGEKVESKIFDIDKAVKNVDKMSDKELAELRTRIGNTDFIERMAQVIKTRRSSP